eukprot:1541116-Pleurochrysis_carterae.AAC.1
MEGMIKVERGYAPLRCQNISEFDEWRVIRVLRRQPRSNIVEPRAQVDSVGLKKGSIPRLRPRCYQLSPDKCGT